MLLNIAQFHFWTVNCRAGFQGGDRFLTLPSKRELNEEPDIVFLVFVAASNPDCAGTSCHRPPVGYGDTPNHSLFFAPVTDVFASAGSGRPEYRNTLDSWFLHRGFAGRMRRQHLQVYVQAMVSLRHTLPPLPGSVKNILQYQRENRKVQEPDRGEKERSIRSFKCFVNVWRIILEPDRNSQHNGSHSIMARYSFRVALPLCFFLNEDNFKGEHH